MPNIKSAEKRVELTKIRTLRNNAVRSSMKTSIRKYETAIGNGNADEAKTALTSAISNIDKAVTKGVLHKNTAARKKARLTKKMIKSEA